MIPPKTDLKWVKFLDNMEKLPVKDLSVKMLLCRVKTKIIFDHSEAVRKQMISDSYDFFIKNEATLKEDIKLIFG
jgi:hypothetical protein